METKEILIIVGFIITSASWFLNSYLTRKNERYKKGLELRYVETKDFLLKLWYEKFKKGGNLELIGSLLINFRFNLELHGTQEEIKLCSDLIDIILNEEENTNKLEEFNKNFTEFEILLKNNFRKSIELKKLSK